MKIEQNSVRKFLNKKIALLSDVIADIDGLIQELDTDYYRVSIFGSARLKSDSPIYKEVQAMAKEFASKGVDVVTGGGPGLMEAANIGAKEGAKNKSRSIGLNIELPFEPDPNIHLDRSYKHKRFSSRLDEFMRISNAIIVTPGGIGTVLEFFYAWQLIQVEHIKPLPVVFLGGEFWNGLLSWMKDNPLAQGLMSDSDFDRIKVCDSAEDVLAYLQPEIDSFLNKKEVKQSDDFNETKGH